MARELNIATIIPADPTPGTNLLQCSGTKVMLADGSELQGVTRIELVAEVGEVWRAKIDCYVKLAVLPGALIDVTEKPRLTWWRKALLRLAGVYAVDSTSLDQTVRTYEGS